MSTPENASEVTDSTGQNSSVEQPVVELENVATVNPIQAESVDVATRPEPVDVATQPEQPVENVAAAKPTRPYYEVVFFVRYGANPRPPAEELTNLFNKYGVVHHVNCPQDRNYAFVFMTSLSTDVEHRRTRTTIGQIMNDMTPETQFHITVASSHRGNSGYRQNRGGGRYRQRPDSRNEEDRPRIRHPNARNRDDQAERPARRSRARGTHRPAGSYRTMSTPTENTNRQIRRSNGNQEN